MKSFMDEDFLLKTDTSRRLYHDIAEKMPILDYHCHLTAKDIYEDVTYSDLAEIWLGGDHYKWRLMRAFGVEEEKITGSAPAYEKYLAWVRTLETAVGNPLYHWTHLELKRYFGCELTIKTENARAIWEMCNEKLKLLSARRMILMSNVRLICTTDDPADDLKYHRLLAEDASFPVTVLPAWRPDQALEIGAPGFAPYMAALGGVSSCAELRSALRARMDFFHEAGCRLSDHGILYVPFRPASEAELEAIFAKKMAGQTLSDDECRAWQTELLSFLAEEYARRDWAMQLHISVQRNVNGRALREIGPNAGFDAMDAAFRPRELSAFLSRCEERGALPRTIGYSLNAEDDYLMQSTLFSFNGGGVRGKMQHGSAWWFNDHLDGMRRQMRSLMASGRIADFVGMLTDSRCFLSYSRHEYFRRILCDLLGDLVENGEYPCDEALLARIVSDICYDNARAYFHFPEKA